MITKATFSFWYLLFQLIAENLDNINDASRKIDNLGELKTILERLESVPSKLKRLEAVKERIEDVEKKLDGALMSKEGSFVEYTCHTYADHVPNVL